MHEGPCRPARAHRLALRRGEPHGRARPRARRLRGSARAPCSTSRRASVEAVRRARAAGVRVSAEASPHHLCATDELVRTLDANVKMNPPLRRGRQARARRGPARRRSTASPPTTRLMHGTRRTRPSRRPRSASPGSRTAFGALHTFLVREEVPLATLLERLSAGPARALGLPVPDRRRRACEPRPPRSGRRMDGPRRCVGRARPTPGCWTGRSSGRSSRPSPRASGVRGVSACAGLPAARGRHRVPGRSSRPRGRPSARSCSPPA